MRLALALGAFASKSSRIAHALKTRRVLYRFLKTQFSNG